MVHLRDPNDLQEIGDDRVQLNLYHQLKAGTRQLTIKQAHTCVTFLPSVTLCCRTEVALSQFFQLGLFLVCQTPCLVPRRMKSVSETIRLLHLTNQGIPQGNSLLAKTMALAIWTSTGVAGIITTALICVGVTAFLWFLYVKYNRYL